MRRVIYTHMVSIDGYIEADESYEGPNWAISDDGLQQHFTDFEDTVDAHLYGRKVYEQLAAGWPMMAEDPDMPEGMVEYAHTWMEKPKVVFSRTLDQVEWNSRLVKEDAAGEVAKLKAQSGKDLALYGGVLASSLIPHGLIDEYRLYVNPVVLGSGTPMFPNLDHLLRLQLKDIQTFDCGVVLLHYWQSEDQ